MILQVPHPELVEQIGVLGYIVVLGFAVGITLIAWLVKRLVDASIATQESNAKAIAEIVKHEATEGLLLDRLSKAVEDLATR